MKFKYVVYVCLLLFANSGCIFSGNDIEEIKLIEPYYITTSGISYDLIVKEKDASTNKVMLLNIDSIGWSKKYVFGKATSEYFIISQNDQIFVGRFKNYLDFYNAGKLLGLNDEMKKVSELPYH